MANLWVSRDGANVRLHVDSGLDLSLPVMRFQWNAGGELAAEVLRIHLENRLIDLTMALATEAYRAGCRDGRGHREGQTPYRVVI